MTKISIATAQTVPVKGDVGENIKRHKVLIKRAADKDVDILLFPELSLTGYELDLAEEEAMTFFDERLRPLLKLSVAHDMVIVAGAPVRIDNSIYIGAFV